MMLASVGGVAQKDTYFPAHVHLGSPLLRHGIKDSFTKFEASLTRLLPMQVLIRCHPILIDGAFVDDIGHM